MGYLNYITSVVCLFSVLVSSLYQCVINQNVLNKLMFNVFFSFIVFIFLMRIIPQCIPIFLKAQHSGIDLGKIDKKIIPESFGIVCGAFYLVLLFINIPINYMQIEFNYLEISLFTRIKLYYPFLKDTEFEQNELNIMLAALLAICCMIMLGFVDDILNLKWRQKLIFPFVASLPILMVYFIDYNVTCVMLPKPFNFTIDLGVFYYVFMVMVVIFCTNSINILAGINGLESGQSVVIALTIIVFNIIELNGILWKSHFISFVLMMPFLAVSLALFYYNWYPADVFVGDTYCYFAGMTFAVVGILGHFSKTMMLFFLPQIFNFIFSVPQLFHLVPCPRHRLPQYDSINDVMNCSNFKYRKSELKIWSRAIIWLFKKLTLISEEKVSLSVDTYQVSNFTLINLILNWYGPLKESSLTVILLLIQVASSFFAFFIRYYLSNLVY